MSEHKERPTFEFHFHDKVGQNIANVENMEVHFDKDMQMQVANVENMSGSRNTNAPEDIPEELRLALEKYKEAGIVDDDLQPIGLSNTEKAVLASVVARNLWKENRWRPFENLWNIKGLGSYYAKALEQKKTNNLIDTYKRALK